jgi:hypothetical protein
MLSAVWNMALSRVSHLLFAAPALGAAMSRLGTSLDAEEHFFTSMWLMMRRSSGH